ncbi:MAG: hypothetical protein AB7O45_18500 [Alphaproteobacteria bacterium]
MLLPLGLVVAAISLIAAALAWRRLARPWNRVVGLTAAAPAAVVLALFAAATITGRMDCTERETWRAPSGDGRFDMAIQAITCGEDGPRTYNVVVVERRPDGPGRVRAIWRSLEAPVPVAVTHARPARFIVHAHDGTPAARAVDSVEVTLEGKDLTPSRQWSFRRGQPE